MSGLVLVERLDTRKDKTNWLSNPSHSINKQKRPKAVWVVFVRGKGGIRSRSLSFFLRLRLDKSKRPDLASPVHFVHMAPAFESLTRAKQLARSSPLIHSQGSFIRGKGGIRTLGPLRDTAFREPHIQPL